MERKCCRNCKKSFFGKTCDILMQNPEFAKLNSSTNWGSFSDPNSDYNKLNKILDENICPQFDSIFIEFPMVVESIEYKHLEIEKPLGHNKGDFVAVRPCDKKYGGKTYFGILLGDMPASLGTSYNPETHVLEVKAMTNPAMYVPELKEVIFGNASWWHTIDSKEQLKEITTEDINNTWYVKLMKEM